MSETDRGRELNEKRSRVVGARLDDGGVMRGASGVEGIFILLLVEFKGVQVNSESSFFGQTFELTAMLFEVAKLVSVTGGGVGEGDEF